MRPLYYTISGIFVFYFVFVLFERTVFFEDPSFFNALFLPAIVFGILSALLSNILIFMKIKENMGALVLMSLVVNFLYLVILNSVLEIFEILPGSVILGTENLSFEIQDSTVALILITLFLSLLTSLMRFLETRI